MADTLARINLLTDLKATLEAATEDGTPGIATDYAHRLGWLSGGAWRWGAVSGTAESFASVKLANMPAGKVPTAMVGGQLVQGSISDDGTTATFAGNVVIDNLSSGMIPYKTSATGYLADSSISEDATSVNIAKPLSVNNQVTQWVNEIITSVRYVKTSDTTIGPSVTAAKSLLNGGVAAGGFAAVTDPAQRWSAVGAASETVLKGNVSSVANQVLVFELYRNGAVSATLTLPGRSYGTATPWRLVIDQVVRVAGSTGTVCVKMHAYVTADNANSAISCYDMSATLTGVDLTIAHTWDVVCTIPSSASNSITCDYAKKIG